MANDLLMSDNNLSNPFIAVNRYASAMPGGIPLITYPAIPLLRVPVASVAEAGWINFFIALNAGAMYQTISVPAKNPVYTLFAA